MIQVFLVCSGLGHVKRGFETFTQDCFDALSTEPSLDINLFKGGGESSKQAITLWNLPRNSLAAIQIGKIVGRSSYDIEQASFTFSLLLHIHRRQPDIIYYTETFVGTLLWHWRRLTKQRYKLLLCNGSPVYPPFMRYDYVQQLTPTHFQNALNRGWNTAKQSLVPHAINMPDRLQLLSANERKTLRSELELPDNRSVILSVAAINKYHKRMDYIIRETVTLPEPRPYLLLLGQIEAESAEISELGNRLLGTDNFQIRTVASDRVADYYKVADVFVLASLWEGFGLVFLEAMSHGLPCLAHDYEVARFVLEKEGYFANFELAGSLAGLIRQVLAEDDDESKRRQRHRSVFDRFSWEKLRPSYVEMIQRVADTTTIV